MLAPLPNLILLAVLTGDPWAAGRNSAILPLPFEDSTACANESPDRRAAQMVGTGRQPSLE